MIVARQEVDSSSFFALDGCLNGWVVGWFSNSILNISFIKYLDVFKEINFNTIFIDIPVILPTSIHSYPRKSDIKAKKLLSKFHSSIFYAPLVSWLKKSYSQINNECDLASKPKISIQSFNLFKKINQIQVLELTIFNKLIEVHPELLFHFFLKENKKSKKSYQGHIQRLDLFDSKFNFKLSYKELNDCKKELNSFFNEPNISLDDILDVICVLLIVKSKPHLLLKNKRSRKFLNDNLDDHFFCFN